MEHRDGWDRPEPLRLRRPSGLASTILLALAWAAFASGPSGADSHGVAEAAIENATETAAEDASDEESTPTATLDITVTSLESDEGVLVVALLDSAAQYDSGDVFHRSDDAVSIRAGQASVRFEDVPYGTYAVKIFHDENSNGELDTNFVGFPKEGFGFSNDAMGRFGPPSFEQAAFEVGASRVRIEITAK